MRNLAIVFSPRKKKKKKNISSSSWKVSHSDIHPACELMFSVLYLIRAVCVFLLPSSHFIFRAWLEHTHDQKRREKENMKERSPFLMMILTRTASKLVISSRPSTPADCVTLSLSLSFSLVNNHFFEERRKHPSFRRCGPCRFWGERTQERERELVSFRNRKGGGETY